MVSLNRADLAVQCLASIEKFTRSITYEVHLVAHNFDEEPLLDLLSKHPNTVVHRVNGVRGYSQNNNVALRAARGRYVVILNDDTVLGNDLFGQVVRLLDSNPDIVGACPVLRYPDGSLQMGIRGRFTPFSFLAEQLRLDRLIPGEWASRIGAFDRPWLPSDRDGPIDIDTGTGACFVARREALEAIGFLDEKYFLAPDDIDWSVRLGQVGRVVLLPKSSLVHYASTTLKRSYFAVVPTVYAGCYTFFRRYYGRLSEWMLRLVLGFAWSGLLSVAWAAVALVHGSIRARIMRRARWNCVRFAFSNASSPEVFARLNSPSSS
jgi:GT2 family glycosyltransferase